MPLQDRTSAPAPRPEPTSSSGPAPAPARRAPLTAKAPAPGRPAYGLASARVRPVPSRPHPAGGPLQRRVPARMLSFAVFDERGPARDWPLRRAHLFTTADEVPLHGEVRLEDGVIRCSKAATESAGLALQFPVDLPPGEHPPAPGQGLLGLLMLRTSLLPERDEPYLLSLELARHRIMLVLNKLEEWQLFDLPPEHPVMRQFEHAPGEFTAALVAPCH